MTIPKVRYRADDAAVLAAVNAIDRNSQMGADDSDVLRQLEVADRRFPDNPLVLTWLGRCQRDLAIDCVKRHSESGWERFLAQACRHARSGMTALDRAIDLLNTLYQDWGDSLLGNAYCGCGQVQALLARCDPDYTAAQREVLHSKSIGCMVAAFLIDSTDKEFSDELQASLKEAAESRPGYVDRLMVLLASDQSPLESEHGWTAVKHYVDPVLERGGRSLEDRRRLLMSFFFLFGEQAKSGDMLYARAALKSIVSASDHVGGIRELERHIRQFAPAEAEELIPLIQMVANWASSMKNVASENASGSTGGRPDPRVGQAIQLNKQSRYAEAVTLLDGILGGEPANVEALVERGIARLFLQKVAPAHEDFTAAIEIGKRDCRSNCTHVAEAFARLAWIFRDAMMKVVEGDSRNPLVYVSEECRQYFAASLNCIALSLLYDADNEVSRLLQDPSLAQLAVLHGYDVNELSKFMAVVHHASPMGGISPHVVPEAIRASFVAQTVPPCPIELRE